MPLYKYAKLGRKTWIDFTNNMFEWVLIAYTSTDFVCPQNRGVDLFWNKWKKLIESGSFGGSYSQTKKNAIKNKSNEISNKPDMNTNHKWYGNPKRNVIHQSFSLLPKLSWVVSVPSLSMSVAKRHPGKCHLQWGNVKGYLGKIAAQGTVPPPV